MKKLEKKWMSLVTKLSLSLFSILILLSLPNLSFSAEKIIIGKDINNDHKYHFVVKAETWFSMVPLGKWSLIGCIVVPAFDYKDFELASKDWKI